MKSPSLLFLATAASSTNLSQRPTLRPSPLSPTVPFPDPSPRTGPVCVVQSHGDGASDDSDAILGALHGCNDGGRVVFPQGQTFVVGTAMDWTFLRHIDIDVQGEICFTNDTSYWQANSFRFGYQNVTSFFKLGGEDVWIYGGGTLNGNGQAWYDLYAADIYTLRPVLVGIDGLVDSVMAGLQLRDSPQYFHFVANASNVVFDAIDVAGASASAHPAKNTDGWDTYRSRDVTIQNSVVVNGDDCVAFKPNSTSMLVQSLSCTGSHGISIGSLGQYPGTFDVVEDVTVANCSLTNSTTGARIKVWPNAPSAVSGDLQGGGGSGRVRNLTYRDVRVDAVDYAIEVTQCYGQKDLALCTRFPSNLTIDGVVFRAFSGLTSAKYQPQIAALACSSPAVCANISAEGIDVRSPNGTNEAFCLNQDQGSLDLLCTDDFLGFA